MKPYLECLTPERQALLG
jgi:hypothetical protein